MKASLIKNILVSLVLILSVGEIFAQPKRIVVADTTNSILLSAVDETVIDTNRLKHRLGVYGNYGPSLNITSFVGLPGVPSCCPGYSFTVSNGWNVGGLYEIPLDSILTLQIRGGFGYFSASYERFEDIATFIVETNGTDTTTFGYFLNTEFSYIELNPVLGYRVWQELNLYGGLDLQFPIMTEFSTIERIVSPNGTYKDGARSRNAATSEIESAMPLFGITLGAGYDLPLQKRPGLFITPEIFTNIYPFGPVSETNWAIVDFRAGVSVKYRTPPIPPPPPPPPALPPYPDMVSPKTPPTIAATLKVVQKDSTGREINDNELVIEDFVSFSMRPLLNYVFFDEGSDSIPQRYAHLDLEQVRRFSIQDLRKFDDLETYYNVLNIVGDRMRSDPDINITLTGNNSNQSIEKGNKELSLNRANSVYVYLTKNWLIDPNRIKVKARNLPTDPSRTDTLPGHEENRRVEITSASSEIFKPVTTNDTIRQISKTLFSFKPQVESEIPVARWELKSKQGNKVLFQKSGIGVPPKEITWNPETEGTKPQNAQTIFNQFTVWDKLGNSATSDKQSISINQLTVDRKRMERRRDKEFEYYGLILFDYGKTSLNRKHRETVKFVKSRIQTNDTVTVLGFSDAMGDEITNKKIAERRANSVARSLRHPRTGIYGIGEENLIFDNSLPEGRFYCRTVRISVESEINENP